MLDCTDILISVHERFARGMADGTKLVELRTRSPKIYPGCRVWLYNKSPDARVTAVATLKSVESISPDLLWQRYNEVLGLNHEDFRTYTRGREVVAALHLGIVEEIEPVSLSEMRAVRPNFHPPQYYLRLHEANPLLNLLMQARENRGKLAKLKRA